MAVSAAAQRGPGRALASQCPSMLDTGSPRLPSVGACKRKPTVTFSKQVCDPRLSEHCSLYQDLTRPCKTSHMELQRINGQELEEQTLTPFSLPAQRFSKCKLAVAKRETVPAPAW